MKFDLPWWVKVGFGIVVLGVGASISQLIKNFDVLYILMAIVLVVLSSITGAIIARLTASQQITKAEEDLLEKSDNLATQIREFQDETQKIINQSRSCQNCTTSLNLSIQTLKQILRGKFGESLITYEDLKQIEGNVRKNEEILVLTSALQLEDDELRDVILQNFKKSIKYKYLIPREDKILQNRMVKLAQEWQRDCGLSVEDAQQQIQCYLVPKHFAYMTVIIYEPYTQPPTVLVKFPTSEFYEKEKYPLIYRVDTKPKEAWHIFVESLQELVDDTQKCCSLTARLTIDFSGVSKKR